MGLAMAANVEIVVQARNLLGEGNHLVARA